MLRMFDARYNSRVARPRQHEHDAYLDRLQQKATLFGAQAQRKDQIYWNSTSKIPESAVFSGSFCAVCN